MNQPYKQAKQPKREEAGRITLNYDLVETETDINKKMQLWCGEKKIGKTVNANKGGAYFLKFEAGHSHIKHHGTTIKDWNHMRSVAREIIMQQREDKFPFDKVCIDTLGECYKRCSDWILNKYGIMHEGDLDGGKGWTLVENAFREVIMPLSNCGMGVIHLAHTEEKELKDDHGNKYKKQVAQLPKGCHRVIGGMVDLLLYFTREYDEETEKWVRVIKTSGTGYYEAGVRYPDQWKRRLPETVPMSWDALCNAWNAGKESAPKTADEPEPKQQQQQEQQKKPEPPKLPPNRNVTDGGTQRRTGTKLGA